MSELVNSLTTDTDLFAKNSSSLVEYKNRSSGLVDKYKVPSKYIDDVAIGLVNNANSIKASIVSTGGNTGLSSACYSSDTSYITSIYGSYVTSIGTTTGIAAGIIGLGTYLVAYGIIKNDSLKAYTYPKIETIDASTENPFIGEGYVNITSQNSGTGKDTIFTVNAGSEIGYVFSLTDSQGCNRSSIESSVSSLLSQYETAKVGIATYTTLATSIKREKTEYQFQVWSYSRKIQENSDSITRANTVSEILSSTAYGGPY